MGKQKLREDKTCLNCKYVVENRFCPNCGQENIEPRKTFYQLFIHFFKDLTHYENAFWKTIKNLILKPSALTKEYLSGKRMSYLAPVRLTIFISFITFFILTVFPKETNSTPVVKDEKVEKKVTNKDSNSDESLKETKKEGLFLGGEFYKSLKELDSLQTFREPEKKLSPVQYWFTKKILIVTENNTPEEVIEKFQESFVRNLPKVLFLYMPVFSFFLWLFQDKKKWYYFDHGIFTLHYFSFLLLIILIVFLLEKIVSLFGESSFTNLVSGLINATGFGWMIYYFFPAHHRFYGETRTISFLKGSLLFFINLFFIILILVAFALYTLINLH